VVGRRLDVLDRRLGVLGDGTERDPFGLELVCRHRLRRLRLIADLVLAGPALLRGCLRCPPLGGLGLVASPEQLRGLREGG
jgi:hypothetical protein